jgi:hypothetical protein
MPSDPLNACNTVLLCAHNWAPLMIVRTAVNVVMSNLGLAIRLGLSDGCTVAMQSSAQEVALHKRSNSTPTLLISGSRVSFFRETLSHSGHLLH